MQNEVQIAEHAVELAKWCERNGYVHPDARAILALASPPEPEKPEWWPGMTTAPYLAGCPKYGYYVLQSDQGKWTHHGPICATKAAAVAAWNKMIDRISGADEETVRLMKDASEAIRDYDYVPKLADSIDRWLAERAERL